jgi:uncharacterized protein (DUF1015 family)
MVEIKPFQAIIYNYNNKLCQPQRVICPPYDIITSVEEKIYRQFSCYNMIHLILPEETLEQNRYQKAATRFSDCLKKGVLRQDEEPAIYIYQQEFRIDSKDNISKRKSGRFKRLGFIARLSLNSSSSIYGHEHTCIEPKEDRFKLLVEVQANLEPIFILFSDPQGFLEKIFKKYIQSSNPLISFKDREKNTNTVWRVVEPAVLKMIEMKMKNKSLFIADGHHRYEVSLNYQDLIGKRLNPHSRGSEDFNYIMTYFCPIQSSGLVIEPIYRLVRGVRSLPVKELERFFYVRRITRKRLFSMLKSPDVKPRMMGAYFRENFYIFILKNNQVMNKIDKEYRSLDVCLLNQLVLKELLKINPEDTQRIVFSASIRNLIRQADIDRTSLVFFIRAVKIKDIVRLARAGRKMPAKTTYFYPKVPSGLVIYKFS